jgi:type VI secretion system secreted protein Hcp
VLSWSWGVNQGASMGRGSGGGEGRADFQDLTFVHHMDKASPVIWQAAAGGEHIKEALLTVRKAGKTPQEYLLIKMNDIIITNATHAAAHDDGGHTETVSLAFSKVALEYKPQKADGSLDAGVHFKHDIKANKAG